MPFTKRKVPGKKCISVSSPGGLKSKCTSKAKADKQIRLLNAIEHGFVPKKKGFGLRAKA